MDREVGYCQGSAFIVGLLLMQVTPYSPQMLQKLCECVTQIFPTSVLFFQMPEEEAFCVFVKLMQDYKLRELFKPSMAELGLCMYQFECMIQVDSAY